MGQTPSGMAEPSHSRPCDGAGRGDRGDDQRRGPTQRIGRKQMPIKTAAKAEHDRREIAAEDPEQAGDRDGDEEGLLPAERASGSAPGSARKASVTSIWNARPWKARSSIR